MGDGRRFVVPDCCEPDKRHDPPGSRPAVYWYEYRSVTGLAGVVMVLCVECCARIRMMSARPDPDCFAPPPTRIWVIRDANTQEPVI